MQPFYDSERSHICEECFQRPAQTVRNRFSAAAFISNDLEAVPAVEAETIALIMPEPRDQPLRFRLYSFRDDLQYRICVAVILLRFGTLET
jgi:hypothetical protein